MLLDIYFHLIWCYFFVIICVTHCFTSQTYRLHRFVPNLYGISCFMGLCFVHVDFVHLKHIWCMYKHNEIFSCGWNLGVKCNLFIDKLIAFFCSFCFSIALALWKKGCQWFGEKKKTKEENICFFVHSPFSLHLGGSV